MGNVANTRQIRSSARRRAAQKLAITTVRFGGPVHATGMHADRARKSSNRQLTKAKYISRPR
jgi:hypothetical protein